MHGPWTRAGILVVLAPPFGPRRLDTALLAGEEPRLQLPARDCARGLTCARDHPRRTPAQRPTRDTVVACKSAPDAAPSASAGGDQSQVHKGAPLCGALDSGEW